MHHLKAIKAKRSKFSHGLTSALTLLCLLASTGSKAGLIGDNVSIAEGTIFGDWSIAPASALVVGGAGPEFTLSISTDRKIFIDIEDGYIDFTYNDVDNISLGSCDLNCFITISGIDDEVTGVSAPIETDTGVLSFGGNSSAFDASSITLFLDGVWGNTDNVRLNVQTAGAAPNPVPAPATLALMGLGLAGLGWKRRKNG